MKKCKITALSSAVGKDSCLESQSLSARDLDLVKMQSQHLGEGLNRHSTGKSIPGRGSSSAKALWPRELGESED